MSEGRPLREGTTMEEVTPDYPRTTAKYVSIRVTLEDGRIFEVAWDAKDIRVTDLEPEESVPDYLDRLVRKVEKMVNHE